MYCAPDGNGGVSPKPDDLDGKDLIKIAEVQMKEGNAKRVLEGHATYRVKQDLERTKRSMMGSGRAEYHNYAKLKVIPCLQGMEMAANLKLSKIKKFPSRIQLNEALLNLLKVCPPYGSRHQISVRAGW